jgi:hypothetical protein
MRYNVSFEVTIDGVMKKEFKSVTVDSNNRDIIIKKIKSMYPQSAIFNFKKISNAVNGGGQIL